MARSWRFTDAQKRSLQIGALFVGLVCIYFILRAVPLTSVPLLRFEAMLAQFGATARRTVSRVVINEGSLNARYEMCEADRAQLVAESIELATLRAEVDQWRALVAYTERSGEEGIAAKVVRRSVEGSAMRVTLDRGSEDGVTVGRAVIVGDGLFFGTIIGTANHTSVVELVVSTQSSVPASLLSKESTIGVVEGREGALLSLEFVPQDADIVAGDIIATSGLEGRYPSGLALGIVTDVTTDARTPFKRAFIEMLYDPLSQTQVMILP
ncbi:rod shape-determining protein MreC [Patescibacteria group bacterium]|nr:rod shape-determining protein MreC [Patescibacteria group bacterium]